MLGFDSAIRNGAARRARWAIGVTAVTLVGLAYGAASFSTANATVRATHAELPARKLHRSEPAARGRQLPSQSFVIDDADANLHVVVYPPKRDDVPQPVTVMLHGMCDEPENECPYFADAVTPRGWLVCPRAGLRCAGGGSIWDFNKRHETLRRSVELVETRFRQHVDTQAGRTLIGFSLGGIFGMDVAHRAQGEYPRVLLIGAKVDPSAAMLRSAGVEKIALVAGDYDMMNGHMQSAARRVQRAGMAARFMSLGKVGHWFPDDMTARMTLVLDWLDALPTEPGLGEASL